MQAFDFERPGLGSTDVGDVSWTVPTVGLRTATWVPGTPAHSWQATAADGMSIGYKGMNVASQTLALTGRELFTHPKLIATPRPSSRSAAARISSTARCSATVNRRSTIAKAYRAAATNSHRPSRRSGASS